MKTTRRQFSPRLCPLKTGNYLFLALHFNQNIDHYKLRSAMIYDFASKERNNTTKEKSQEIRMVIENESQDIVHSSTPRPLLPLNLSLLVLNRLGTNSQTMRTAMEYAFRDKGDISSLLLLLPSFVPHPPPPSPSRQLHERDR